MSMKKFFGGNKYTPNGYSKEVEEKVQDCIRRGYHVPKRTLLRSKEQIEGIREAGKINKALLDYITPLVKEGVTTAEIDHAVYAFTTDHDAIPAPFLYEGFPKSSCISINDVVCHGIPSTKEVIKDGDIVNVDLTTIYKGHVHDWQC